LRGVGTGLLIGFPLIAVTLGPAVATASVVLGPSVAATVSVAFRPAAVVFA
jgi:hypothetical protein